MKKVIILFTALFAFAFPAAANDISYKPLFLEMRLQFPDTQDTSYIRQISRVVCDAVLYDQRGYFAIKKDPLCEAAYKEALNTGCFTNIIFALPNPELQDEPFYYESEDIYEIKERVKDEGDYYTFYITPDFLNTQSEHRSDFKKELKRLLAPFGGALTREQIMQALERVPKPKQKREKEFVNNVTYL